MLRKGRRPCIAVFLAFACLIPSPSLADSCYLVGSFGGVGPGNDLLTLADLSDADPATNETSIGTTTGVSNTQSIGRNLSSGNWMAVAGGTLGILDTTTGLYDATGFVPVGTGTGIHQGTPTVLTFNLIYGLSFDAAAGVFYAASRQTGPDVLLQIDPVTGARVAGAFGGNDYVDISPVNGLGNINGLAVDPLDGALYAVALNAINAPADLVQINKATGAAVFVGDVAVMTLLRLSFTDDGQLWGYANDSDFLGNSTQKIFQLDKTGSMNPVDSASIVIDNDSYYAGIACRGTAPVPSISGTVFEDVNYGGGGGRGRAAASADAPSFSIERGDVTVELYDAVGTFLGATTTSIADGSYGFFGLPPAGYTVRVVNATVTSSRPGSDGSELAVQVYRIDADAEPVGAGAKKVGGEFPSREDAAANSGAQTLASLQGTDLDSDGVTEWTQSIVTVDTTGGDVNGVDFGFNFDTIVNTNGQGQGSLRQFILNSNLLN